MGRTTSENELSYWHGLIEEWGKSDLTQQRFCEERQINFIKFKNWRYRLKKGKTNKRKQKVALTSTKEIVAPVNIKPVVSEYDNRKEMHLMLPNGIRCVLPIEIEISWVGRLVEVLLTC